MDYSSELLMDYSQKFISNWDLLVAKRRFTGNKKIITGNKI